MPEAADATAVESILRLLTISFLIVLIILVILISAPFL